MANATLLDQNSTDSMSGMTDRLRRLRSRVTTWFLVDGLSRLFAATVLLIGFDLLLDWLFEMDRPQRIVMLGLIVAALGFVVWKWIVLPFRQRSVSDDALCLQVEAQNANLGESLISALQFSRQSDFELRGVSAAMVTATIRSGARAAEQISLDDILRRDRFLWNCVLLVGSLVGLAGIGVGTRYWEPLQIWWQRNVLLRNDVSWPQDTLFNVDGVQDGLLLIPRGDDWLFVAHIDPASKEFPDAAEIEIRKRGRRRTEIMKPVDDIPAKPSNGKPETADSPTPRKRFEFLIANIRETFEFRIRSASGRTDWISIRLVDRPEVDTLELSARDPKYAGGRVVELPAGKGPHYVLKGSRLTVSGTATKELSAAEILIGNQSVPLTVDGRKFSGVVPAAKVGGATYRVRLVDTVTLQFPNELKPRRLESKPHTRFRLKIRPDRVPKLTLKLNGIGGMVVPDAIIPCVVSVQDDFAITAARLKFEWRHRDDTESKRDGNPLQLVNDALKDESRQPWKSLDFRHSIKLKSLKIKPGSSFTFHFEADDNDDVSGPKIGKTRELTIRVVSEAELRDDLLRREKEQQQEFERLTKQQDKLYTETNALRAGIAGRKDVPANVRGKLRNLQKQQATLGKNLTGIADRLASIVAEFRNNHLIDDPKAIKNREQKIIAPMRNLARKLVPAAVDQMAAGRRMMSQPQPRDKALSAAKDTQKTISASMASILTAMNRTANFQEIVNLTYRVLKAQQGVLGLTDNEIKALLRRSLKAVPNK